MLRSRTPYYIFGFVCVLFFLALARRAEGSLINTYPFMPNDAYDWIHEGYSLLAMAEGHGTSPLPFLRPPVFVFINVLDAAVGGGGAVVFASYGIALLLSLSIILLFFDDFAVPRSVSLPLTLMFGLSPINSWRVWILSDPIAVSLMLASVYLLVRWYRFGRYPPLLLGAAGFALMAGLTQAYGFVAFAIMGVILGTMHYLTNREPLWGLLVTVAAVCSSWLALNGLWLSTIPHQATPSLVSLLSISGEMIPFYLNTWTWYFLPLLPLLLASLKGLRFCDVVRNPIALAIWVCVSSFALLTLFYQWVEGRFTFIWFGLFVVGIAANYYLNLQSSSNRPSLHRWMRWATLVGATAVIFQTMFLFPGSNWRPRLASIRIAPKETWIWTFLSSGPVDRFSLLERCGSIQSLCPRARRPTEQGVYVSLIFDAHMELIASWPE